MSDSSGHLQSPCTFEKVAKLNVQACQGNDTATSELTDLRERVQRLESLLQSLLGTEALAQFLAERGPGQQHQPALPNGSHAPEAPAEAATPASGASADRSDPSAAATAAARNSAGRVICCSAASGPESQAQTPEPASAGSDSAVAAVPWPPAPLAPGSVAMAATRVVMHQLVLPADVNQLGICTGGQVLSWIDVCAGLSAKTLAHGPCVTATVDAVHFLRPCRLGFVVIIGALVARTFNTSMEVAVVVESEDMRTGVRRHCCSAHLTFVTRPRDGAPAGTPSAGLPRVFPTTPDHRAVWEGAEVRRQLRLERRTRVRRNPELQEAERVCRLKPITHREGGPTLPPAVTLSLHKLPAPPPPVDSPPAASGSTAPPHRPLEDPEPAPAAALLGPRTQPAPPSAPTHGDESSDSLSAVAGPPAIPAPAPRPRVAPDCTTAYMTQSIMPQHANTLHITFGGQVMSWMEQCAYISASRLRAPVLLTAAMDSVSFVRPTRVGDILYITAQVSAIFGSSLEVMVSVFGESPFALAGSSNGAGGEAAGGSDGGGIFHCADAFVTVVAVDERHASPVQVPFELEPQQPADVLRYQGAIARRSERLTLRGQFAASETSRVSLDGARTYSPPPEASDKESVLDAMPPL